VTDFRDSLYQRYVTGFKGEDSRLIELNLLTWYKAKYLPLLDGLDRSEPILDLGCGQGHFMRFLLDEGFSAIEGIDAASAQVAIATSRGLHARVFDAFEFLSTAKPHYRAIVALDFIEHFSKQELMCMLPLIYQALDDDGVLLLQTPNGQGLFSQQVIYGDLTHMTVFSPDSLKQLLSLVGFGNIRILETGPIAKNLTGRIRLMLWKLVKKTANAIRMIEAGKTQEVWTENMICICTKPPADHA
jgi:2-polyprenyl-3-methyl-5-hydroxy-6-metoxy-1,4-benzoquinol methylase